MWHNTHDPVTYVTMVWKMWTLLPSAFRQKMGQGGGVEMPLAGCPSQSEALSTPGPLVGSATWDASPFAAAPTLHPCLLSSLSADSEDSYVVEVGPARGTPCAGDS